jgi:gag-polypeptide of LTR copia-type
MSTPHSCDQPPPPPPLEIDSSSLTSDLVILLNLPISTKLTAHNYLSWQSQITPILHGHDLYKFLTLAPPNPTISVTNGTPQLNPAYLTWHRQDQLILGWLRSSLTESLLAQVVSCSTFSQLWTHLQSTFSASSRARQADLRRQLQTTTKGTSSCSDYLQKARSISDELAFIGAPVSDADPVMFALTGLSSNNNAFVVAATTASRNDALSFTDLHSLLLTNESLLHPTNSGNTSSLSSSLNPSAFYANKPPNTSYRPNQCPSFKPKPFRPYPGYRLPSPNPNPHSGPPNTRPNYQSRQPLSSPGLLPNPFPQSSPANPLYPNPPALCQICSKRGHTAKDCWHRYDARYGSSSQPHAHTAHTGITAPHGDWYLDLGATHHVTSDLNNISTFIPYEGFENLHIGNGTGMKILHIGSSILTFPTRSVVLNDILHVPQFTKNLLSLSKLLHDNSLLIEFSPTSCLIKDRHTLSLLLRAKLHNGFYSLHLLTTPPLAFLGEKVPADTWHARLGHPSIFTTSHVLTSYNLPCSSHTVFLPKLLYG